MGVEALGPMIRRLREAQKKSREEFCQDQQQLSVRQLVRIENQESLPSLNKLEYIANELGMSVSELLNPSDLFEYSRLKSTLEMYSIDFDSKSIEKIDDILEEMYETFYDSLPYDEKMYIDCTSTAHDLRRFRNSKNTAVVLKKYKFDLQSETHYSIGKLQYLALHMWVLCIEKGQLEFEDILYDLIKKADINDIIAAEVTIRIYINASTFYLMYTKEYAKAIDMLELAKMIVIQKKLFKRLPIIQMLEAKVYLKNGDKNKAQNLYERAIELSETLNLKGLNSNIIEEMKTDIK